MLHDVVLFMQSYITAPEAKAALDEFVSFLAQLAVLPNADGVTLGETYKRLSGQPNKWN